MPTLCASPLKLWSGSLSSAGRQKKSIPCLYIQVALLAAILAFKSFGRVCIDLLVLMSRLFCALPRALGVPITDYSFEDCQLAMAEGQLRLPVDTCLLEYAKLVRRLG